MLRFLFLSQRLVKANKNKERKVKSYWSYETSGEIYNYLVGFPYPIGKYMLYYNGETVGRLLPIFRMAIFFVLCVVAVAFDYAPCKLRWN